MANTVNLQHVPKLLVYLQNVFLHHTKRERLIWSSGDSRNEGQVSFLNILDIRYSRNQSLPSKSQRHEHGKEILTPKQWATDVYWADALWTLHMVCINYDTMMWYLLELLIPNIIIHMSYTRKNSLIAITQCKFFGERQIIFVHFFTEATQRPFYRSEP